MGITWNLALLAPKNRECNVYLSSFLSWEYGRPIAAPKGVSQPLEPVTVFGKRVFADVIKLRVL